MVKIKKKVWMSLIDEIYPKKRKKTKQKIYSRLKSRIYNWKAKYSVNSDEFNEKTYNLIKNKHICKYCKHMLTVENFSLDHIIPIARGGEIDNKNNMQIICKRCNRRKGQLTDSEYVKLLTLIKSFENNAQKYIFAKLSSKDFG